MDASKFQEGIKEASVCFNEFEERFNALEGNFRSVSGSIRDNLGAF